MSQVQISKHEGLDTQQTFDKIQKVMQRLLCIDLSFDFGVITGCSESYFRKSVVFCNWNIESRTQILKGKNIHKLKKALSKKNMYVFNI